MHSRMLLAALLLTAGCHSTSHHDTQTSLSGAQSREAFERLAALAGDWKGEAQAGDEKNTMTTSFALTGGGSAVVEAMFKGSPHEMVTVYHMDGDLLRMTHYCSAGNQPRMVASRTDGANTVCFDFAGATNLASEQDMHMHEAKIRFVDADHIESWWTAWVGGKPDHTAHFNLERVSAR